MGTYGAHILLPFPVGVFLSARERKEREGKERIRGLMTVCTFFLLLSSSPTRAREDGEDMNGRLSRMVPQKEKNNLPERMTTLTSFSSLEISELEVKGLILSLFQVILVADGSNYLSHFFGTISHGNLKEITSTSFHQSLIQSSSLFFIFIFDEDWDWWNNSCLSISYLLHPPP